MSAASTDRREYMYCRKCGYALEGLSEPRCPECGRAFDPADPRTFHRRPQTSAAWRWLRRMSIALLVLLLLAVLSGAALFRSLQRQTRMERQIYQAISAANGSTHTVCLVSPTLRQWISRHGFFGATELVERIDEVMVAGPTVDDEWLNNLQGLVHLKRLRIGQGNRVTDAGLTHLASLTKLESLELEGAKVQGPGLVHLQGLKRLRELALFHSPVAGPGLQHLRALPKLYRLELADTPLSDADMQYLADLTTLEALDLRETRITDAGLAHLRQMTKMCTLYLGRTAITDAGLPSIRHLTWMQSLDLSGTQITDAGLVSLKQMPRLYRLSLAQTRVTDAGFEHLRGTRNLGVNIRDTAVTNEQFEELRRTIPGLHHGGT